MQVNIIIRNGMIIDPANNREEKGDLYIRDGLISEAYDPSLAAFCYDAAGLYVFPGLVDYHTHIFSDNTEIGINADLSFLPQGITSAVDAGSAGVSNMESFVQNISSRQKTEIKTLINLSPTGLATMKFHENVDPACWDKAKVKYFLEKYPSVIKGLKIRISKEIVGDLGIAVLEKAVALAAELGTRLVVHVTNPPETMDKVVSMLRPGDVAAHCFHGTGHTILGADGKVLPAVKAAQDRGVIMDAANGGNHWSFDVAEAALAEGFCPDIISTDITVKTLFRDPVFSLPFVMSKYLNLGMPLAEVVKRCTVLPAQAIGLDCENGCLSIGRKANVAIFKLLDKETTFTDTQKKTLKGSQLLSPLLTIRNGSIEYRSLEY